MCMASNGHSLWHPLASHEVVMKVVFSSIIPFRGFLAVTLWPFIFVRRKVAGRFTAVTNRHEHIHGRQQVEMLVLPFFLWYLIEWILRLVILRDSKQAYRSISFEQEAYANEGDATYLVNRRPYAWLRYLFK